MNDGTLVPRKMPGAMIHDRQVAIERTVRMIKEGCVESIEGKIVPIKADSICVHGDNPDAIGFVKEIRERLLAEGIEVVSIEDVIGK